MKRSRLTLTAALTLSTATLATAAALHAPRVVRDGIAILTPGAANCEGPTIDGPPLISLPRGIQQVYRCDNGVVGGSIAHLYDRRRRKFLPMWSTTSGDTRAVYVNDKGNLVVVRSTVPLTSEPIVDPSALYLFDRGQNFVKILDDVANLVKDECPGTVTGFDEPEVIHVDTSRRVLVRISWTTDAPESCSAYFDIRD